MNKEKYNQIISDAYKNYCEQQSRRFIQGCTYQEFVEKIKTDDEFAKTWGLKIEERELSLEERCKLANFAPFDDRFPEDDSLFKWDEHTIGIANGWLEQHHSNLPTKLITVTYNNEKIEVYE